VPTVDRLEQIRKNRNVTVPQVTFADTLYLRSHRRITTLWVVEGAKKTPMWDQLTIK